MSRRLIRILTVFVLMLSFITGAHISGNLEVLFPPGWKGTLILFIVVFLLHGLVDLSLNKLKIGKK